MALPMREHVFEAEINGALHTITFYKKGKTYHLNIDGEVREIFKMTGFLSLLLGDMSDYSYDYMGTEITLAVRYHKTRLAVNGIYNDNGDAFVAVKPLPMWSLVFTGAIIVPPFVLNTSMTDIITSLLFAYLCHDIFINPAIKAGTALRAFYCFLVTLVSWFFIWFFNYM